ncbi:hypothetical protein F5Y16DRAFT_398991 [Xylariaceae sp. FL0255]|nr:hypothetical protein F5Y16DRAFT_398991 [Xylariaceae sp. FL0255]
MPDYNVAWQDLFRRFVQSSIGNEIIFEIEANKEIAVLKAQGYILDQVSPTRDTTTWHDRQHMQVALRRADGLLEDSVFEIFQAIAISIEKGDIIVQFWGAPSPSIIRLYEDYCVVIAIATTLTTNSSFYTPQTSSLLEFPLVWSWDTSQTFANAITSLFEGLDRTSRLVDLGVLLRDVGRYDEAARKLQKALDICREGIHDRTYMDAVFSKLGSVYRCQVYKEEREAINERVTDISRVIPTYNDKVKKLRVMADMLERQGNFLKATEESIVRAAGEFDKDLILLLLDSQEVLSLSETVAKAAVENIHYSIDVLTVLFEWQRGQLPITGEVVKAAAEKPHGAIEVLTLLFEWQGDQLPITEEVLKSAARRRLDEAKVFELLVERQGDQLPITKRVVEEVIRTGCETRNPKRLEAVFERRGDRLPISRKAVKLALTVGGCLSVNILNLLLEQRGDRLLWPKKVVDTQRSIHHQFRVAELAEARLEASSQRQPPEAVLGSRF